MSTGTFGIRTLHQPAYRQIVVFTLIAIVGAFRVVQLWLLSTGRGWAWDFAAYWTAAGHLLKGESPYSPEQLAGTYVPEGLVGFLYPPPFAVVTMPLAAIFPTDYGTAGWVWAAVGALILTASVVALARSEHLATRLEALALPERLDILVLVAAAFLLTPVVAELSAGNVHLEILGLFSLAWLGVRRGDATGERIAGLAVGAAAVIKLFPGLLILWFLATGRRTAATWAVVGSVVIAAVLLPITGIQGWLDYPFVLANMGGITDVQDSVSPTIWLRPIIGFGAARAALIVGAVALVVVAARNLPERASYALAVTASVLAAPAVFHHYLSILVLPLLLALAAGVRWRYIALIYLLLWGGQQPALGDWSWVLSRVPQTLAYLLLIGVLITVRRPADVPRRQPLGAAA